MEHNHNIRIRINKEKFKKKLGIVDGHTPTKEELLALINPLIPKVKDGKDGKKGKDGKDGSSDTAEQIAEKLNTTEKTLDWRVLKNVPDLFVNKKGGYGIGYVREIADVSLTNLQANDVLKWNPATNKWENGTVSSGGGTWGSITGTLSDQTDLQNALNAKQDTITTGTTAQYFRGDLSLATFPTLVSSFTNDAGYITASSASNLTNKTGNISQWTNDSGYITASALTGYVPNTRTLTINGTSYDLSADRSWSVGTVTSVAALTLGTSGTDLSSTVANSTTTPVITLNVPTASSTNRGALSSTDWTTFNNKFTLPSLTSGSVLFSNGTTIAQDNANFFWDDTNDRLGLGTASPSEKLHLYAASGNVKQLIQAAGGATTVMNLQSGTNIWSFAHQNNYHSGNLLLNFGGTNYTTNALEVTTTGNFGFGTATPSEAIHLYAPSGDRKILSEVTGGATTAFILKGSSTYWNFAMNSGFHSGNLLITNDNTFTTNAIEISTTNRVGIGVAAPSARLHLPAGTATASTAPLKFTAGTNLTTAEAGAFEYDGNSLFFTPKGTLRSGILMTDQTNFNTYTQASKGATAFTSGTDNFLAGYIAGGLLTSGSQNVAIGNYAGYNFSNALGNVAIGYWANRGNASVETTVMIGYQTGYLASGASYSTFIGGAAGYSATNAVYSVFIGHQAGQYMSAGDRSVSIGYYAGYSATNAAYSEFLGTQAGYFATNAAHGFFGGYQAGYGATNAANSVFIGQGAGRNATSAVESIFIGKGSGNNAVSTGVTGDYNIGLGTDTGKALTSGVGNTFIGYKVGDTVTTGSKNLLIGYDIDAQSNTADGQLSIQNAIFGTGNTGTGTTASTGKIGIYTVAPTCALDVTGGIATSRTAVTAPAATDGNIFSGTYTPTLTGVTNVSSSTAYVCQYMRVGNVVTVSGKIEVTPTINNTQTTIGISLPISSNFASSQQCGGTAHTVANTVLGHGASIYADATNDRAEMDYFETHGGTDTFNFTFTYKII